MLNFVLCDDDSRHNIYMSKRIEKIITDNKIKGVMAFLTTSPDEIVKYSDLHKAKDNVYILDIDFQNSKNGVDLAKYIRKNEAKAYIIYVSAHQEYSMLCYKTKTFDFLLKPIQVKLLEDCIKNLYNDYLAIEEERNPSITIKSGAKIHVININELVFCEKFGNIATFHTNQGLIQSYDSLESIQDKLEKHDFYRCHKSFLINLNQVDYISIQDNLVFMKNGEKCSISRNYKKGLVDHVKRVV